MVIWRLNWGKYSTFSFSVCRRKQRWNTSTVPENKYCVWLCGHWRNNGIGKAVKVECSQNTRCGHGQWIRLAEMHCTISQAIVYYFQQVNSPGRSTRYLEISKCDSNLQKGSRLEPTNYRGISLTSIVGKTMETFVRDKQDEHFAQIKLLNQCQQCWHYLDFISIGTRTELEPVMSWGFWTIRLWYCFNNLFEIRNNVKRPS